jgi:RNA polymerase sigma-32 factor
MNARLSAGDQSLNAPVFQDGDGREWQDMLVDERESQEFELIRQDEMDKRKALLRTALSVLKDRERAILHARHLKDEPETLDDLAQRYGISRERVRQIETRALEKVRVHMRSDIKSRKTGITPLCTDMRSRT